MPDFFDPNEQQPTGPRISDARITYQRETPALTRRLLLTPATRSVGTWPTWCGGRSPTLWR